MKNNTLLKQKELFDQITVNGLNLNQYYILCSMYDSISPILDKETYEFELNTLKINKWISKEYPPKLSERAIQLVEIIESNFRKQKRNIKHFNNSDIENIKKYNELFPKIKLPSGYAARCSISNLEQRFKWFFAHNKYSWKTIFEATELYKTVAQ